MADNLTIQIAADTSKLRADLAVAQAQVKVFGAELRAEATASLTSGDASGVGAIAARYDRAALSAARLKKEISGVHEEEKGLSITRGLRGGVEGFESARGRFSGGIEGLFSNLPVSGKGIAAAGILAAVGALTEAGVEAAEWAHDIAATSTQLGISTGQMRAWTLAARGASVSQETLTKSLTRLQISAEKAADKEKDLAITGAEITADKDTTVLRGGRDREKHQGRLVPPEKPADAQIVQPGAVPPLEHFLHRNLGEKRGGGEREEAGVTPITRLYAQFRQARDDQLEAQKKFPGARVDPDLNFKQFATIEYQTLVAGQDNKATPAEKKDAGDLHTTIRKFDKNFLPPTSLKDAEQSNRSNFPVDAFAELGIAVVDVNGKLREMGGIAGDVSVALHKLIDEGKQGEANKFLKTEVGREAIRNPHLGELFNKAGEEAGGFFRTPAGPDPEIEKGNLVFEKGEKAKAAAEDKFRSGALKVDEGAVAAAEAAGRASESINRLATEEDAAKVSATALAKAFDLFDTLPGHVDFTDKSIDDLAQKIRGLIDLAKSAGSALGSLSADAGSAAAPFTAPVPAAPSLGQNVGDGGANTPSAFAWGGQIRGAGSGTSDSILARVSHGEFIVNAADTARNLPLLHSINSGAVGYAMGGLVGAFDRRMNALPAFAAGGAIGGGQPVHLHLGNQSYPLSGKGDVVTALVAEAHRQQMTSAGVKPSWFAGRPSGR